MRSVSPETPFDPTDRAIFAFDVLWDAGVPSLDRFWADLGPDLPLSLLSTLIKIDLTRRFERGERPRAADFLARFPELARDSGRAVSIIYEEFCLLEENGESPSAAEFCEVYEPWRDSLASQLVYHRELSQIAGAPTPTVRYPLPGERFASFHLRSILGKGGAAQVYLATEEELGGRRVALKISASVGREPSILANLDHRGIVPILTVAESAGTGLRGICMPYRPGETLEGLIHKVVRGTTPRKAKAVWDALKPTATAPGDEFETERDGWAGFPTRGTYHEAVAFIGLCLANATGYLHGRGVLHRDIKPANILLAYREGPQLLDFNLAHTPNQPEHAHAALKGGTLPYMAPEQLLAFLDPALWSAVGSSADIYALGLVLKELVTGLAPDAPDGRLPLPRAIQALHDRRSSPSVPLRQINPSIPPALESIISRCLAFEPAGRYPKAEDLATDLRRFLDRKPLRGASNTSLMERVSNFVYRNWIAAGMLLLLGVMTALIRVGPGPATVGGRVERSQGFSEAREDYLSPDRVRWERARGSFERLGALHPGSAWPVLYQGLTLERLKLIDEANGKFDEAVRRADFEGAVEAALSGGPPSPTLLTVHAVKLVHDKRYQEARKALTIALELQPERIGALELFGKLEREDHRAAEAVPYLRRAIAVGEAMALDPRVADEIFSLRAALLDLLAEEVDGKIDFGPMADRRLAARPLLDDIAAILKQIESSDQPVRETKDQDLRNLVVALYGGSVASARAVFAAEDGAFAEAEQLFTTAHRGFQKSRELVNKVGKPYFQSEIEKRMARNATRMNSFPANPKRSPPQK